MTATDAVDTVRALRWHGDCLELLDQRRLPSETVWLRCDDADDVAGAITDMVVRGAPAIGIAAGYGLALAARSGDDLGRAAGVLGRARPTAINLHWAIERMTAAAAAAAPRARAECLAREAEAIHAADVAANRRIGALGAAELGPPGGVLTHCNTGALATGGYGSALGVIRSGYASGRVTEVFACETRPWLQGARLTLWELMAEGIPATALCDGAAAALMRSGRVRWVVLCADRVAANGDIANKIGTYALAVLARQHGVGFMVAVASSTIDPATPDGSAIPIEMRSEDEVLAWAGHRVAPAGARAWNPVFDVTPAALIDVLVTERGVVYHPDATGIARMAGAAEHAGAARAEPAHTASPTDTHHG